MEAIFCIWALIAVLVGYVKLCDLIAEQSPNHYSLVWIISFFISPILGLIIVFAEEQ